MTDTDKIMHPSLSREDLVPEAREPETEAQGIGFGSYDEGPVEQQPDASTLSPARATDDGAGGTDVKHPGLPNEPDPWGGEGARDFRRDDPDDPTLAGPNEVAGGGSAGS